MTPIAASSARSVMAPCRWRRPSRATTWTRTEGPRSVGPLAAQIQGEPVFHLRLIEPCAEQGEQLAERGFAGHAARREQPGSGQLAARGIDAELHMTLRALADGDQHHAALAGGVVLVAI